MALLHGLACGEDGDEVVVVIVTFTLAPAPILLMGEKLLDAGQSGNSRILAQRSQRLSDLVASDW